MLNMRIQTKLEIKRQTGLKNIFLNSSLLTGDGFLSGCNYLSILFSGGFSGALPARPPDQNFFNLTGFFRKYTNIFSGGFRGGAPGARPCRGPKFL